MNDLSRGDYECKQRLSDLERWQEEFAKDYEVVVRDLCRIRDRLRKIEQRAWKSKPPEGRVL